MGLERFAMHPKHLAILTLLLVLRAGVTFPGETAIAIHFAKRLVIAVLTTTCGKLHSTDYKIFVS